MHCRYIHTKCGEKEKKKEEKSTKNVRSIEPSLDERKGNIQIQTNPKSQMRICEPQLRVLCLFSFLFHYVLFPRRFLVEDHRWVIDIHSVRINVRVFSALLCILSILMLQIIILQHMYGLLFAFYCYYYAYFSFSFFLFVHLTFAHTNCSNNLFNFFPFCFVRNLRSVLLKSSKYHFYKEPEKNNNDFSLCSVVRIHFQMKQMTESTSMYL